LIPTIHATIFLQDPPELIPELYKKYKEGFKIVGAKRKSRKGETFIKKFTAKMGERRRR